VIKPSTAPVSARLILAKRAFSFGMDGSERRQFWSAQVLIYLFKNQVAAFMLGFMDIAVFQVSQGPYIHE